MALAWVVVPGNGVLPVETLNEMVARVALRVQQRVKRVGVLADRGVRACDWAQRCEHVGWHDAIGVPCTTDITCAHGRRAPGVGDAPPEARDERSGDLALQPAAPPNWWR